MKTSSSPLVSWFGTWFVVSALPAQEPEPEPVRPAAVAPLQKAASVLEGLEVELKTFTAKDSDLTSLGLGLDYERQWELAKKTDHGVPVSRWALALRGRGNVSFDADVAPNDILEGRAGLDGEWFLRSDSGSDWVSLLVGARAHGGFESDQEFTARQTTYGGTLVLDLQGSPNSWLADWNPFDLPFRLTRWLTGWAEEADGVRVVNRAEAFPAVMVTAEEVDSTGQDPRQAVGETSGFLRLSGEVAMSAPFVRLGDYHVAAEFGYRAWYEPGAAAAVRDADLDFYDVVTIVLKIGTDELFGRDVGRDDGVFVSYRNGQTPFDVKDEDVFEVGLTLHF